MTDVELVIKISEKTYKDIQSRDWKNAERWFSEEWKAIHNGIPLPKGHGRLIDADEAIQKLCGKSCGCTLEECGYEVPCFSVQRINSAQTVIEADKEQKT